MGRKCDLTNKNYVMVIAEERGTIRTLFDDKEEFTSSTERKLNLRARFNPGLYFYKVNCNNFIRYGLDSEELFEMIEQRYKENNCNVRLNELFTEIERI